MNTPIGPRVIVALDFPLRRGRFIFLPDVFHEVSPVGAAVGLGNIWKFPYVVGVSGGGAFVLVYLLCVAIIAIPILIGELLIGAGDAEAVIANGREETIAQLAPWFGADADGKVTRIKEDD